MPGCVHQFFAMASQCAIHLQIEADAAAVQEIAQAGEAEVHRVERRYSRYGSDSELTRINRVAERGGEIDVDPETAGLLDHAFAAFRNSGGLFDISCGLLQSAWDFSTPCLPAPDRLATLLPRIGLDKVAWSGHRLTFGRPGMGLDFGGLGKEYAADRAAEICLALGATHGFVDLGGDIRVLGPRPDGSPWRFGIRHPRLAEQSIATIEMTDGAVATSGDYERFIVVEGQRYCHILDPRTGWPVQGLASATVLAARCLAAGILSTTAILKGTGAPAWLSALGMRHVLVDADGCCCGTEPLPDRVFEPDTEPGRSSDRRDPGTI
jgi:FAD:protein FMN transferase